ncbi:hypothetical protein AMTR_s00122p00014830 [Amborella trichopoda]|uniref:RNase H type-1 domain-containing protein n=1 Tax=Amborella trichopoda TaxID=13333 RepID=W1NPP4_AMBTC|nr:hypothetical protein AMTR_s00122p00014830 [Amborella trichopoda]
MGVDSLGSNQLKVIVKGDSANVIKFNQSDLMSWSLSGIMYRIILALESHEVIFVHVKRGFDIDADRLTKAASA